MEEGEVLSRLEAEREVEEVEAVVEDLHLDLAKEEAVEVQKVEEGAVAEEAEEAFQLGHHPSCLQDVLGSLQAEAEVEEPFLQQEVDLLQEEVERLMEEVVVLRRL